MMKSFEQFIIEGRDAPLYHGTSLSKAADIIRTGVINNSTMHNIEKYKSKRLDMKPKRSYISPNIWDTRTDIDREEQTVGFSTTRDFRYAREWAGGPVGIVFEFNQRALVSDFKVKPFNYWGGDARGPRPESEEFVVSPRPVPIFRYLKGYFMTVDKHRMEKMKRLNDGDIDYKDPRSIINLYSDYYHISFDRRAIILNTILQNRYFAGIKVFNK